jgi:hypothetical protein
MHIKTPVTGPEIYYSYLHCRIEILLLQQAINIPLDSVLPSQVRFLNYSSGDASSGMFAHKQVSNRSDVVSLPLNSDEILTLM